MAWPRLWTSRETQESIPCVKVSRDADTPTERDVLMIQRWVHTITLILPYVMGMPQIKTLPLLDPPKLKATPKTGRCTFNLQLRTSCTINAAHLDRLIMRRFCFVCDLQTPFRWPRADRTPMFACHHRIRNLWMVNQWKQWLVMDWWSRRSTYTWRK